MPLTQKTLSHLDERVARPGYDRSEVTVGIVHFGVGGFHRAHQAMYLDTLMNSGRAMDWGIFGVGVMPPDKAMADALSKQDHLYTLMLKDGHGNLDARVIGSIVDYAYAPDEPQRVLDVLTAPSTRIVSLTVTEGGYNIDNTTGAFDVDNPVITADVAGLAEGKVPVTMYAWVAQALQIRRERGIEPFTVMSCDNIQSNGDVARSSIAAFAGLVDPDLAQYIRTEVLFPNAMVDRITPVTTPDVIEAVSDVFGIDDAWPVACEPFTQWVLQDSFQSGVRPPFEEAGVQMVADVEPYELMKLRLLNAGHQAIAYAGHLCGYTYAHEPSSDPLFVQFLRDYWNHEARLTLAPVEGIDVDEYCDTLIERFANPEVRDTIARLASYASDRIPKFVVPVIRANLANGLVSTRAIAIAVTWARYAEAIDEQGQPITVVDVEKDEVLARGAQQKDDPLALARSTRWFGDLADDPRFAEVYTAQLALIHEVGAREFLSILNKSA
ncbi:mannitol dehydrogenase family protein [Kineosporia sp. NBRC 101731]|uniref:mannitol dehydrogenase family protein n=1 Tax=Kineosporia sp. NBRC 101731 TaxID=3032199 RepID=UPI0024A22088|nr:mannitol dehydrogenase family protein [Kineosporia sp. NBRC 101731]GLY32908.1 mannitol 2-dehydrogenase [Kineosporia sp. NBRC 101731]